MKHVWPVPELRYTSLGDHSEEREVALIYSQAAWDAVSDRLSLPVASRAEVAEATETHWNAIDAGLHGDVLYAVGGGLAADAAKYVAAKRDMPIVSVPTALSVDAFFTWASGVRGDGCVVYVETKPPDLVVLDLDVIAAAPDLVRASGICDVLSIATGCADWVYAHERDLNPPNMPFLQAPFDTAQAILNGMIDAAESAGRGDAQGLMHLVDALVLEVQLCNLIGHSRPEEGSEHYFAYCAESLLRPGMSHGELVGPGIVKMAQRHGVDVGKLERALHACHVPLDAIPEEVVAETLHVLPEYCRKHDLPHGIAHDLAMV